MRTSRWKHWRLMPQVELWEAVALSFTIDPGSGPGVQRLYDFRTTLVPDKLAKFDDRLDVAKAHIHQGSLPVISRPASRSKLCLAVVSLPVFAKWAKATFSRDIPREFSNLAALAPTQDESATLMQWPWGSHDTKLLRKLADAAERFWKRYDPTDPTTAPTNEQVSKWLESPGVSQRVAEVMAQILRADDLPAGRRK